MRANFWSRWCRSILAAARSRPAARGRSRRRLLGLATLEDRVTPALTPQMVMDVNATTLSSGPSALVAVGSTTFFVANDGVNGLELWKSDGTAAGTMLVKDVNPGSADSSPTQLTNVNGTLYFTANNGVHGAELWKSNGTAIGTVLVKDIYPGIGGSGPESLTNVNGTLFFSAYDGTSRAELWKSDGTAAGTMLVKVVRNAGLDYALRELTNLNGTLFFSAHDYNRTYSELWKSDGTTAGTVLVKSFDPYVWSDSYPNDLTNVNGTLLFSGHTATTGFELWKSDGTTAGTVLVKDIEPGPNSSAPRYAVNINGTLFFAAYGVAGSGRELLKSDGTAAGTTVVRDVNGASLSYPRNMTDVNGTLFLSAGGSNGLWKSDGTPAGTVQIRPFSNPNGTWSDIGDLTNVGGTLFFAADDGEHGDELWKSDGTTAGTIQVTDILAAGRSGSYPAALANVNGTLMFAANDGRHGVELWKSDGTAAGTRLVKDIRTDTISSYPANLADVNGTLFFAADDGAHGMELWKSDGTVAGTTLVKDISPGGFTGYYGGYSFRGSSPSNLTNVNGTLFFTADDGTGGMRLWKSDGTATGTVEISSAPWPSNLTDVNGTMFFTASDFNGTELWKSDGTVAGTVMVKDIYPGESYYSNPYGGGFWYPNSSSPGQLTNVNGTLFFVANDGTHGREVWKSDGTAAGTVLVEDVRPGSTGSIGYIDSLRNANGTLFFSANDGTTGSELWQSDGTTTGTALVEDIRPGANGSYPSALFNKNGTVFFSATDGTTGAELWRSDGTAAGTVLVRDLRPGIGDSSPRDMEHVNGLLFFAAYTTSEGWELWKSDGTAAGTSLVKDIVAGSGHAYPGELTNVNGTLVFTAAGSVWASDGTAAGTQPIASLSIPRWLTMSGGALFFSGGEGVHGTELWKVVDSRTLSIGDATVTEGHGGTVTATFTVSLSEAHDEPVTVAYVTADGSATADSDFQATSGTLTFAPGDLSETVTVLVNGDRLGEPNEAFFVDLSGATNAVVLDGRGVGTIVDDEPRVSIGDATVTEGNTQNATARFTVSISAASNEPVTISYATVRGTATSGTDFQSTAGSLTIPAGETSATVSVTIIADRLGEPDETFLVTLSDPINAFVLDELGIGTILDDEPRVRISDVTLAEGRRRTTTFTFTVTLSAPYDQPVTMSFHTADGTARTSDSDYVARSGTITFAPGETSKSISISVNGDNRREANETFFVDLTGLSSNAFFDKGRGVGTILNDD